MDLNTDTGAAGSERVPIAVITAEGEGRLSVTEAARALAQVRKPKEQNQPQAGREQRAEGAALYEPVSESTSAQRGATADKSAVVERSEAKVDAAPDDDQARGETESVDPASDPRLEARTALPPIEPPRSWTKEDKELFTSLPRETQERVAERERLREGDFLRRQNEAAEKLKGLSAKEQAVEQARQHYEGALPQLLVMLQQQQTGEFADIKTLADVERLAREDWPRYALWDVQQKKIAEVTRQLTAVQERQALARLQQFSEFAMREDDLFKQKVTEMADAKKAADLQTACLATLTGLGFAEPELAQSWQGQKDFSLRDHRVQLLVRDATLWREAQQKAKAAQAKPVPPVQRPGVAHPKGAAQAAQIQNLTQQLEQAKGVNAIRTAAKLVAARRASR